MTTEPMTTQPDRRSARGSYDSEPAPSVAHIGRGDNEVIDILGIHCVWKVTEADSGGHYCMLEMHVPPGAGVPMHQHAQQETFVVVEGDAEFTRLGRGTQSAEWFKVAPGETVNVPSWAMHGFRNPGEQPIRILLICARGIEPFFREAGVPVVRGAALPTSPPSQESIARVIDIAMRAGQRFAPPT
jgi:mannose-6-phosphate isomerase-like protein (cupin superfamily)